MFGMTRRECVQSALALGASTTLGTLVQEQSFAAQPPAVSARRANRIAVSTYSFWRFRQDSRLTIAQCIDEAARMGFDGVEILHRQMDDETPASLQRLKRQAFTLGMDLCGFSTHQGFVSPDVQERKKNIEHTKKCIDIAYRLGIGTMRVNTGRWNTTKSFDELMANKGIEPKLDGYSEDDGFRWVIESLQECLPMAEQCGVILGLENHWGLGRTAQGVLRIVEAIKSPWLQVTMDTGNFFEQLYEQRFTKADYRHFYHVAAHPPEVLHHLEHAGPVPELTKW